MIVQRAPLDSMTPVRTLAQTHPAMRKLTILALFAVISAPVFSQFNTKGRFHFSLGASVGGHATSIDQEFKIFGLTIANNETGSAATLSLPIELGVGLGKAVSLGLAIEPGSYVPDTNNTDQKNAFAVVALQPRFYILNKDRLAWSGTLQVGGAALRVKDDTKNATVDERYSGPAFGFGTALHLGLSDRVGLDFHLRYLATRMELRAREYNGNSTMDFYNATLTTGGVIGQLSLSFRFGGN